MMIINKDGFFTGLPLLLSARDLKVKSVSFLSKEERLESKLAKEQAKIQKTNQRIHHLASQAKEMNEEAARGTGAKTSSNRWLICGSRMRTRALRFKT